MDNLQLSATMLQQCGVRALMTVGAHQFKEIPYGVSFKTLVSRSAGMVSVRASPRGWK